MAVFFTSLLPQFTPFGGPRFASLLVLGACFWTMTFVWLGAYALAVARAKRFFDRSALRRALDAATGALLVALGLRLAAEQR